MLIRDGEINSISNYSKRELTNQQSMITLVASLKTRDQTTVEVQAKETPQYMQDSTNKPSANRKW